MDSRIRYLISILAGLMVICTGLPGYASPKETLTTPANAAETVDTITVTAQKTQEDVLKIPVSVSVFSDAYLEDAGVYRQYGKRG